MASAIPLPNWSTVRRILVVRLDNIGDVVMLSPALRAIKHTLPEVHLTLLASPAGAQAAPLLPWINEVLVWRVLWQDLGRLQFDPQREWALLSALHEQRADAAIIFTSFSQTPHAAALACALADIPIRLGASKELDDPLTFALPSGHDGLHQVERNLRLIESVGFRAPDRRLRVHIPDAARREVRSLLAARGHPVTAPYILWSPWTSCQARTYFPERMASAAGELAEHMGGMVVVVGREQDRARAGAVLATLGERGIDCLGLTTVPQLAAMVAEANLVLTNNTLTLHLADALHVPMVVTYSGTDLSTQWAPRHTAAAVLRRTTPCSPCYLFSCPTNRECMDIAPEEIVAAGLQLCAYESTRA